MTGFQLKLLAMIAMTLDHIGCIFFPRLPLLRMIGRLAMPILCFFIGEGLRHTRNPQKYLLRLVGFALISELPFDLAFYGRVNWASQNVYFTLALGLMALRLLQSSSPRRWGRSAGGGRCCPSAASRLRALWHRDDPPAGPVPRFPVGAVRFAGPAQPAAVRLWNAEPVPSFPAASLPLQRAEGLRRQKVLLCLLSRPPIAAVGTGKCMIRPRGGVYYGQTNDHLRILRQTV